jgi:cysteinyl-tRNA synthetase
MNFLSSFLALPKKHHGVVLYNTKTKQKETLVPIRPNEVRMYTCGPTVYSEAHIGNMRAAIFSDILYRTLVLAGYTVKKVMNITDVGHLASDADDGEDKIEKAAKEKGQTADEIAQHYTDIYMQNLAALNVDTSKTEFPRATQYIKEQIAMVQTLEEKGYTYTTSDGVYFDTSAFQNYGALGGVDLEGLQAGARVAIGEKKNPTDFALWKLSPQDGVKRQQEWESPWGVGFPGWHIECSAMSRTLLGKHFDIHTGAIDLIPIHHNNEIAQSECANGCEFVNIWMHCAFLNINDTKISKSLGNVVTVRELVAQKRDPLALRYFFLQTHYRTQTNYTEEAFSAAETALKKLRGIYQSLPQAGGTPISKFLTAFSESVCDDLHTPQALAVTWELVHSGSNPADMRATLDAFEAVLGLKLNQKEKAVEIPAHVQELVNARQTARTEKNWTASDRLRDEIKALGFSVKDTETGPHLEPLDK